MASVFNDFEPKKASVFDDFQKERTGGSVFDDFTVKTTPPEAPYDDLEAQLAQLDVFPDPKDIIPGKEYPEWKGIIAEDPFLRGFLKATKLPELFGETLPEPANKLEYVAEFIGGMAETIGELYLVGAGLAKAGLIPAGKYLFHAVARGAAVFGTQEATKQARIAAAEVIHDKDFGYRGGLAITESIVIGGLLSAAHFGFAKVWKMWAPGEQALARKVLGVKREASFDDVHKAFRAKAMEWHPDKFIGRGANLAQVKTAQAKFVELVKAKDVLYKNKEAASQIIKRVVKKPGAKPLPQKVSDADLDLFVKDVEKALITPKAPVAEAEPIFAAKKPVSAVTKAPTADNPYLRMPLEQVKEDAANGVKLAKDALIDLKEISVSPASDGQKNKIIRTSVGHGLNIEHLSSLSKQVTGISELDQLTSEDADDLLKALDRYRYMDTWKTEAITKEPEKLIDPAMTKEQMNRILRSAGSIEAYNKAMIYSQKLGGAPSDPGLAAIWHRDMLNHSRYLKRETARQVLERGKASIVNPYQSMSYALDKAERRTGIPLRRQWSDMVATSKGWNNKNEEMMWEGIKRANVSRLGIVTNREASTHIAQWLNEEDEIFRSNMWNEMSSKTKALAKEAESLLQEYAPLGVRWARFVVWDRHARIGEEMLNKLHREGKTPTDKQIAKAQEKMREKKPPDALMSVLAEGRAARESGQLMEWLDTQKWGIRKRYYMNEGTELANDLYEGSISELIFKGAPEVGELTTAYPSELRTREGKGDPAESKNIMLDILRHLDRVYTFASTYEQRMEFWEAFRSAKPSTTDLGLMRGADKALRGIMPQTLPIFKLARSLDRLFWRSYLVFDPRGSIWFGWRQMLQNLAFVPSQFNMKELGKSMVRFSDLSKAKAWAQNNPDAAENFMEFWNKNVAENRAYYRHFIMKSEYAGGLEMSGILPDYLRKKLRLSEDAVTKVGTLVDMLAFTPGISDRANRSAIWPLAYDMAERNLHLFRNKKLNAQGLWNRLALNNVTPGESMEMAALIKQGDDSLFMSRYAEYKTEKVHGRYNPLLRGIQEMTPEGRITMGLITFPRIVINIAIKGGVEPIADMMHNPSAANARRSYDGIKTLIKLFAGTSIASFISVAVTGASAYGLWHLLFGPSLLSPGFGKMLELLDENSFILRKADQERLSPQDTAARMVANAVKSLEMFIPMAEVYKDYYETVNNRDGVRIYDIAIKYAKKEWLNQYPEPFTYRSREVHEKFQKMIFGKEGPKKTKWKESFNIERNR